MITRIIVFIWTPNVAFVIVCTFSMMLFTKKYVNNNNITTKANPEQSVDAKERVFKYFSFSLEYKLY